MLLVTVAVSLYFVEHVWCTFHMIGIDFYSVDDPEKYEYVP
jgi:hypothetical protein